MVEPRLGADEIELIRHYARVSPIGVEQDYCDWCYGPLTTTSRAESERLGLAVEFAWACDACLAGGRPFEHPPGGWDEDFPWPFLRDHP